MESDPTTEVKFINVFAQMIPEMFEEMTTGLTWESIGFLSGLTIIVCCCMGKCKCGKDKDGKVKVNVGGDGKKGKGKDNYLESSSDDEVT